MSDVQAFYLFAFMSCVGAIASVHLPDLIGFAVWTAFMALRSLQKAGI
jgi:hypothetical protein